MASLVVRYRSSASGYSWVQYAMAFFPVPYFSLTDFLVTRRRPLLSSSTKPVPAASSRLLDPRQEKSKYSWTGGSPSSSDDELRNQE